jgi:hypothetical protein
MDLYSRLFHPGLKIAIFSPGLVLPVWKPGLNGGYEPGLQRVSPPVIRAHQAVIFLPTHTGQGHTAGVWEPEHGIGHVTLVDSTYDRCAVRQCAARPRRALPTPTTDMSKDELGS